MMEIRKEEYDTVDRHLTLYPSISKYYDNEKILKQIFSTKMRYKQHPLFWHLLDYKNAEKLSKNLHILNQKCNKFKRILKKLYQTDMFNFKSTITEIDVLSYFFKKASKDFIIEYEPQIKGKSELPDAKIITDGNEFYLEIFTIFEDARIQNLGDIHQDIRMKVDSIENNPLLISYALEEGFKRENIDEFVAFIKSLIGTSNSIKHEDTFSFEKDGGVIANVTFYAYEGIEKGFVSFMHSPILKMKDASRIKNKILDELEQLPSNEKNIVVVNLSNIHGDNFLDVEDAFLGKLFVIVDKDTLQGKEARKPNGIIHHSKGRDCSLIIAYNNHDFSTRRYYHNLSASKIIQEDELDLF